MAKFPTEFTPHRFTMVYLTRWLFVHMAVMVMRLVPACAMPPMLPPLPLTRPCAEQASPARSTDGILKCFKFAFPAFGLCAGFWPLAFQNEQFLVSCLLMLGMVSPALLAPAAPR